MEIRLSAFALQVTTELVNVAKARHYVRIQTTLDSIDKFAIDGFKISGLFFTR